MEQLVDVQMLGAPLDEVRSGVRNVHGKLQACRVEMVTVALAMTSLTAELQHICEVCLVPTLLADNGNFLESHLALSSLQQVERKLGGLLPWFDTARATNTFLMESISAIQTGYEAITGFWPVVAEQFPAELVGSYTEIAQECQGVLEDTRPLLAQLLAQRRDLELLAALVGVLRTALEGVRAGTLPKATVINMLAMASWPEPTKAKAA
ncbi:hypothetical protein [Chitinimonas sp.]|uniref:hypothetical protein n=1 Tax=Chitinimonas sp. TaxID=1934313 RepID=UPI002F942555